MLAPLAAGLDDRIVVGPETADDAGVFRQGERDLIATADFITPVCDDPIRFGRIAATNAMSDVFAMGGTPLFGLNLCCFPGSGIPEGVLGEILEGAQRALADVGAVVLGGHTVRDPELKYGLAIIGEAPPERLLTLSGARPGDALILTKPLGTGALINAFKVDKLDADGLEPALQEMERPNAVAAQLALRHGAHAATDVTGFGLCGHAYNMARASGVGVELDYGALPVHAGFYSVAQRGVTTGCDTDNAEHVASNLRVERELSPFERQLLYDPQTSGGLLVSLSLESADVYLDELLEGGHTAARIGRIIGGEPAVTIL